MNRLIFMIPIIAGILFGSVGIFVRVLSDFGFSNATIFFLRVSIATVLILVFLLIYNKDLLKIKTRDIPIFIGTGILGMMALNLCYNNAIGELTLSLSAVLLSSAPIFVMFIAAIIFKEKVTKRKIICMLLAIVGCVLASGVLEQSTQSAFSMRGLAFGVMAAFFYGVYSIFSRLATDRGYNSYTVIFYSVFFASMVLTLFADFNMIEEYVGQAPVGNLMFLCIHSLCTSILPYIFITLSLIYVEAGKVSILASGSEPASAAVFGIVLFGEVPTLLIAVGIIITVTALILLCRNPEK